LKVAVALGSSLGDRQQVLERALAHLDHTPGVRVVRVSRWVRTPPLPGGAARNWFLNGVALLESTLRPEVLLARCVALEEKAGRRRNVHWGDRTLDIDLLVAEGEVVRTDRLELPHPAIASRPFVLGPLLEVWPDVRDPHSGVSYAALPVPAGPHPVPRGVVARGRLVRYL
jgi:2-amino-4-hydroxy-6-hydroxymethyldihydropteridine diphosphokinase